MFVLTRNVKLRIPLFVTLAINNLDANYIVNVQYQIGIIFYKKQKKTKIQHHNFNKHVLLQKILSDKELQLWKNKRKNL